MYWSSPRHSRVHPSSDVGSDIRPGPGAQTRRDVTRTVRSCLVSLSCETDVEEVTCVKSDTDKVTMASHHQPQMTSSPIKPVNNNNNNDFNDANIWCGDSGNHNNNSSAKVRSTRQTVEQQLQNLALSGETVKLIKLLEDGAPFVVDMVRKDL